MESSSLATLDMRSDLEGAEPCSDPLLLECEVPTRRVPESAVPGAAVNQKT